MGADGPEGIVASSPSRRATPVAVGTQKRSKVDKGGLGETVKVILQALLLALVVRTLLFQPFNIPSGSMKPTLLVGDYIFVSKFSYGYSRYSAPLGLPLFDGRIFGDAPARGDVAVFKLPTDPSIDYVKRVIGLPGDRIQMKKSVLYINGEAVPKVRVEDFSETTWSGGIEAVERYIETLPNGVSYEVLDLTPNGISDNTREYVVPPGHYFMMGDNRDNSSDSRVQGPGRLRALRELRRSCQRHLLLGARRRPRLGALALAMDGALGPHPRQRAERCVTGSRLRP